MNFTELSFWRKSFFWSLQKEQERGFYMMDFIWFHVFFMKINISSNG
jgi:hypothetical protein